MLKFLISVIMDNPMDRNAAYGICREFEFNLHKRIRARLRDIAKVKNVQFAAGCL
jgi:hypothetical protein